MLIDEERILKEHIKNLVREAIYDYFTDEGRKELKKLSKISKDKSKDSEAKKKNVTRVINQLKSKGVNKAQYAYKLWPNKDKASARSYFYKCLNHKKNDDGDTYSFDNAEAIDLRSMYNNEQL